MPTVLQADTTFKLPAPRLDSEYSIEQALATRRSVREFSSQSIALSELSQLLWAAQGITNPRGLRTAPSAGALYPLEVYIVVGNVTGLNPGVYKYNAKQHELIQHADGDIRNQLPKAAFGQSWIKDSAAVIVIAAVEKRTTGKYGKRGIRYIHIEVGHAAQNIFLQSAALGLGSAVVGAFDDYEVEKLIGMHNDEQALYIMPVGKAR